MPGFVLLKLFYLYRPTSSVVNNFNILEKTAIENVVLESKLIVFLGRIALKCKCDLKSILYKLANQLGWLLILIGLWREKVRIFIKKRHIILTLFSIVL